jgi:hypothetical protein
MEERRKAAGYRKLGGERWVVEEAVHQHISEASVFCGLGDLRDATPVLELDRSM